MVGYYLACHTEYMVVYFLCRTEYTDIEKVTHKKFADPAIKSQNFPQKSIRPKNAMKIKY